MSNANNIKINNKMKRERSKNYIEEEKEHLLTIVESFLNILENKKTDAVSSQEKNKAWQSIAQIYNSSAKTGERTGLQLKLLYESLKKLAKKHKADDKIETYKTGSGSFVSQTTNTDSKIMAMNGQLNSLVNPYDSNYCETDVTPIEIIIDDTIQSKEILNLNEESSSFLEKIVSDSVSASGFLCEDVRTNASSEIVSAPKQDLKKTFFKNLKKNKALQNEENYYAKKLEMSKERHVKKIDILEIIKQRELLELKLKELEVKAKF